MHLSLLSIVEPSNFEEAKNDENWIKEMEEELSQIEKNDTWELVPRSRKKKCDWHKMGFQKQAH